VSYQAVASAEESEQFFGLYMYGQYKWFQYQNVTYDGSFYCGRVASVVDACQQESPYQQSNVSALLQMSEHRQEAF
jgi:hypothetical protein